MKVKNLEGDSGRAIPNQFVIKDDNKKIFQFKKELRKGHHYIVIGRFIIRYYEGMR